MHEIVAYCFLKDKREVWSKSTSAFVTPFFLPIPIHRHSLSFWCFHSLHFTFSHQLEFILLCGLRWKSNLRVFFFLPDREPIFPTPFLNNSFLPPWFVKAPVFWVTKTGNSQWHYATKITCFQCLTTWLAKHVVTYTHTLYVEAEHVAVGPVIGLSIFNRMF